MPDLVFKIFAFLISTMHMFACSKSTIRTKFEICLHYELCTIERRPLTSLILNIVNIDILNIEQFSHIILVLKLLALNR